MKNKKLIAAALILAVIVLGAVYLLTRPKGIDFMADGRLILCLDAGHGGSDAGAVFGNDQRLEKDDNLALALAVGDEVAKLAPDIEIVMTRADDTYLTLEERSSFANDSDSDLFVSFHRNSAAGASGNEIWVEKTKPAFDTALAKDIQKAIVKVGVSKDRGVKSGTAENPDGNYYVLGNTDMPGCLIESGFISSEEDNALYDANLQEYAKAIAAVLVDTLKSN